MDVQGLRPGIRGRPVFLRPPDDDETVYEFFAPFVHIPGRYEWCRIRSPTHGVFDCFIVLGADTSAPATVYVDADHGEAFMAQRYPECTCVRADEQGLLIDESVDGRRVEASITAPAGPVRKAHMVFQAEPGATPRQVSYGGEARPVWGSRYTCWGVDLELDATVTGRVEAMMGVEELATHGIVTLGSFGRIAAMS